MRVASNHTHTYRLSAYPTEKALLDGTGVTLRPMAPEDETGLLEFFLGVPEEERYYLKEDVTAPAVIKSWAEYLDYDRVLPLLALHDGRIVADATLHRRRAGARRHTAEIRLVVAPDFQGKGLGTELIRELLDIAADAGLDRVVMEVAEEGQKEALAVAQREGFVRVATLRGHIRDTRGRPQNLGLLEMPLGKWYEWWRSGEAARE